MKTLFETLVDEKFWRAFSHAFEGAAMGLTHGQFAFLSTLGKSRVAMVDPDIGDVKVAYFEPDFPEGRWRTATAEDMPVEAALDYDQVDMQKFSMTVRMGWSPRNRTLLISPVNVYGLQRTFPSMENCTVTFSSARPLPRWLQWLVRHYEQRRR